MSSSPADSFEPKALAVVVTDEAVTVDLADGRKVSVPIAWYPRLARATVAERSNWRFVGHGDGIHWPELDEDSSIDSLLAGRASRESNASLEKWLDARKAVDSR
jgi:hypothetical protein